MIIQNLLILIDKKKYNIWSGMEYSISHDLNDDYKYLWDRTSPSSLKYEWAILDCDNLELFKWIVRVKRLSSFIDMIDDFMDVDYSKGTPRSPIIDWVKTLSVKAMRKIKRRSGRIL